jgi:hypothetical protein
MVLCEEESDHLGGGVGAHGIGVGPDWAAPVPCVAAAVHYPRLSEDSAVWTRPAADRSGAMTPVMSSRFLWLCGVYALVRASSGTGWLLWCSIRSAGADQLSPVAIGECCLLLVAANLGRRGRLQNGTRRWDDGQGRRVRRRGLGKLWVADRLLRRQVRHRLCDRLLHQDL